MRESASHPRTALPAASARKAPGAAHQRFQAPRETEEELTARVSTELKRALSTLAAVALVGLGLAYLWR